MSLSFKVFSPLLCLNILTSHAEIVSTWFNWAFNEAQLWGSRKKSMLMQPRCQSYQRTALMWSRPPRHKHGNALKKDQQIGPERKQVHTVKLFVRSFMKCFRVRLLHRHRSVLDLWSIHHQSHQVEFRGTRTLGWELGQVLCMRVHWWRELQGEAGVPSKPSNIQRCFLSEASSMETWLTWTRYGW